MNQDIEVFKNTLISKNKTVSFAESCTGGLLSSSLVSLPGASICFKGSVVAYSNEIKTSILGVSDNTLKSYGAVSEETAKEMASGTLKVFSSDIAIAVTGIAGPGGATEEKPVGLVHIAATDGVTTVSSANRFYGDRDDVRKFAVATAIRDGLKLLGVEELI